ncbi:unnamed protein product, partial [Choristocarpus tenellus]
QDRAKPHTNGGIMEAIEEASGTTLSEIQSANSSDLNVNNLGFFHSIQQLKEDLVVTNIEEHVEVMMEMFNVYSRDILEHVWQSLFTIYGEVLGSKGDNTFRIPHLSKEKAEKAGKLPPNAPVDETKY